MGEGRKIEEKTVNFKYKSHTIILMRVAEINIGYDFYGQLFAYCDRWDRAHTNSSMEIHKGEKAIRDFALSLRQDGYRGRQALKVVSETRQFSNIGRVVHRKELEVILDDQVGLKVEVYYHL